MLLKMMAQEETIWTIEDTILPITELVKHLMPIKVKQGTTMKKMPQVKLVSCHTLGNHMEGVLLLQTAAMKMRIDQPQQPHNHNEDEDDARPIPRRNDRNEEDIFGKLKFTMPKFQGEEDPDAYLSWVLKVDKIFRIHNFSEAKKVAMASLEFEGYANVWWEKVNKKCAKEDLEPIDTWEEMQEVMHKRFVRTHHKCDLFNKLTQLKQIFKSVEEYYKEIHMTMMSANVDEREEQTMARFFNGSNTHVKRIVEFLPYTNMVELLHQATRAERQEPPKQTRSVIKTTSFKPEQSTMSSKASTGSSNITCFKCGAQGHKSFECKNTRVMITRDDGNVEYLSEGEYEALVQAATNLEDDDLEDQEQILCVHDASPSLVVTKVLTTHALPNEDQRCNIFQTRAGINGKSIKVIIDGGSCHNLASTELCSKLNLTLRKHPHPYHVQWLSDNGNVKIQHTVTISFKIGSYEDTVECDVVPMTVCHILLGRPWQYNKRAYHDGYTNAYSFKAGDKSFILRPMTPSQVIADNAKALARAKEATITSEMSGERVIHQKESERHKPYVSEMKIVLVATKSEMREEFQDVFPDELPQGLPPLRGIEHRIDLIPGAPLPNRAAYRTNPEDTKEIQRQIQDLLEKGDEGFIEPPPKKAKSDAVSPVVVASEASAPKAAPMAQASTASSLSKGKDISPTTATAAPFSVFASRFTSLEADKVRLQEEVESSSSKLDGAVKIAAAARQEIDSLKEELARLKKKLEEEEASRLVAEARAAEKDEVLHQSSLALLEAANIHVDYFLQVFPVPSFADDSSVIALNHAEENKRIHERVHALTQLSSSEEIFWREHSKASAVVKFQDRVQQVHQFFDKCYKAMRVVWKTMFPLNAVPPTLLTLMSEFGNAKKVRELVRSQVFAGAKCTLALVLACYPSACLLSIANATGDFEELYPKVLAPAHIIVDRLEEMSKVPEERETPQG
ncbi:hypothetical protein QYE76_008905 [Lolium multiflorum]|uniref:CCHC-type domain-containing protein n=1 Tax=Lolium multiflorum TaxID=4521 RepID=A0AAD8X0E8_LOLMU|nr:hypothetical protein QYE76_008905 [Lolium multiflorum]